MKKFIIILFTLFICCNLVKADCACINYLKNNKAIVINEKGATTYENVEDTKIYKKTTFKIPYGAKVTLYEDEAKIEDDYLVSVVYQKEYYTVKASDFKAEKKYNNKNLKLKKTDYYTYEDTEVRSGPGIIYDVIGVIKADTNVYSTESIDTYSGTSYINEETGPWIYISDGKIGGYIFYDTCCGGFPIKIGTLIKNKNNYYYIGNDDYGIGLKRYDKINIKYVVDDHGHHQSYYIEYNGKNALINEELIVEKFENQLIFLSFDNKETFLNYVTDITGGYVYDDKPLNKSAHLKIGQKYNTKYHNITDGFDNYYIEVDGKMYRVVYNLYVQDNDLVVYDENKIYNIEYKGKKIEAYKILNRYDDSEYDNTEYYNSKYGIINLDEENEEDNEEENITDNNQNNNTPDDNINNDIENNVSDENEDKDKDEEIITGISSKQYVTWCLIGSIILSAISEILIVVLNKSKN